MGKNNNSLLGRKREKRETEEEDELAEFNKTRQEKENHEAKEEEEEVNSEAGDEESSSSHSEEASPNKNGDKKPTNSLFGDIKSTNGGLFGNLDNNGSKKPLDSSDKKKESKLFSDKGASNLFSDSKLFTSSSTSLFSNTNTYSSLFATNATSTSTNSLFSAKPLFNFSSLGSNSTTSFIKEKNEEVKSDEEGEGDNDLFQSNSPNPYNQTEKVQPQATEKSLYKKKYLKEIENIYIYSKDDNKFVSKGKGFLSLEFADIEEKKVGVIVFRNTMGIKIIEGFLSVSLKKLEKYVKNFKHVASISFLQKNIKTDKFEIGYAKIPFMREEESNEFEKVYNEINALLAVAESKKDAPACSDK